MNKIYYCELCKGIATHTIQAEAGTKSFWCTKHLNSMIKKLTS